MRETDRESWGGGLIVVGGRQTRGVGGIVVKMEKKDTGLGEFVIERTKGDGQNDRQFRKCVVDRGGTDRVDEGPIKE